MKFKGIMALVACLSLFLTANQSGVTAVLADSIELDIDAVETYIETEMERHRLKGMPL